MEKRLSDRVYEGIQRDIVSGKLRGNTFLVESEVAEQYQVSKAPVKAALQNLAQEGLLICYPRRGYMVVSVSVDEYRYVRELRLHIERFSIEMAVQRASDAEIRSLADALEGGEGDAPFYNSSNTHFHMRLAEISKNPYLAETLQRLLLLTLRYASGREDNNLYHRQIIEALLRRDKELALLALGRDLNMEKDG